MTKINFIVIINKGVEIISPFHFECGVDLIENMKGIINHQPLVIPYSFYKYSNGLKIPNCFNIVLLENEEQKKNIKKDDVSVLELYEIIENYKSDVINILCDERIFSLNIQNIANNIYIYDIENPYEYINLKDFNIQKVENIGIAKLLIYGK